MSEGSLQQSNEIRALQVLHIFERYSTLFQFKMAFKYQIVIFSQKKNEGMEVFLPSNKCGW